MNPHDLPTRRYTYDEIAAHPDEARRELHDGAPIFLFAPGRARTLRYSSVLGRVMTWLYPRGAVFHLVDWQLDEHNSIVLEGCFFRRERAENEKIRRADGQCLIAAPDLAILIFDSTSSPSVARWQHSFCATRKVPFLWEIDVETRRFRAFQLEAGSYRTETDLGRNESFSPTLFPNLTLSWSEIFAEDAP